MGRRACLGTGTVALSVLAEKEHLNGALLNHWEGKGRVPRHAAQGAGQDAVELDLWSSFAGVAVEATFDVHTASVSPICLMEAVSN